MRHFHLKRNTEYCPTINVDELWHLLPEEAQQQALKDTTKAPVIDLKAHGVFKLLGRGRIERPVVVKAKFVSSIAEKKIKAAGGIASLADAEEFIRLGADRLGTSRVVKIAMAQEQAAQNGAAPDAPDAQDTTY